MVHDTRAFSEPRALSTSDQIEMPRATIAPLTLSLGVGYGGHGHNYQPRLSDGGSSNRDRWLGPVDQ